MGVVSQGVSQSDASVTRAVTAALGNQSSTVNYMAQKVKLSGGAVDLGVTGLFGCARGEKLSSPQWDGRHFSGPCNDPAQCIQAIETGISLAQEAKETGASILLTGEMGIGNTTTSCAVAVFCWKGPGQLGRTGLGTV